MAGDGDLPDPQSTAFSYLDSVSYLVIRAVGMDDTSITHLAVMNDGQHKNPTSDGVRHAILYNLFATRMQTVYVKNICGDIVCKSNGGLRSLSDKMMINWITGERLGEIDSSNMTNVLCNEKCSQMKYSMLSDSAKEESGSSFVVQECEGAKEIATISCWKDSAKVCVKFSGDGITTLNKAVIMMAALKLYHVPYELDKHYKPVGIPALMSPQVPQPPSLQKLSNLSKLIFRYACVSKDGNKFTEVLDESSGAVAFVIEHSESFQDKYTFADPYGAMQFTSLENFGTHTLTIFNSNEEKFGWFQDGKYFEKDEDEVAMIEKCDSLENCQKFSIFDGQDSELLLANISLDKFGSAVCLSFQSHIKEERKAMIIASAARLSSDKYKLYKHCAPTLWSYSYRPRKEEALPSVAPVTTQSSSESSLNLEAKASSS